MEEFTEARQLLAHLAAFHSRVLGAWAAGVSPTGWGLREVLDYAGELMMLRDKLRAAAPKLFDDLVETEYGASIVSRYDLLRQLILDSHGIIIVASHAGLCENPGPIDWPERAAARPSAAGNGLGDMIRNHAVEIAVAVIATLVAGYILHRLGWI